TPAPPGNTEETYRTDAGTPQELILRENSVPPAQRTRPRTRGPASVRRGVRTRAPAGSEEGSGKGPALVAPAGAGVQLDQRPVRGTRSHRVEAQARLHADDRAVGVEAPLLVVAAP